LGVTFYAPMALRGCEPRLLLPRCNDRGNST